MSAPTTLPHDITTVLNQLTPECANCTDTARHIGWLTVITTGKQQPRHAICNKHDACARQHFAACFVCSSWLRYHSEPL